MNNTPYRSILNYFFDAKSKYSVHSPFVFDFVNNVLLKKEECASSQTIEKERSLFLKDKRLIDFIEFGAGSKKIKGNQREIKEIASSSLSGAWQCRLMKSMVKHYKPGQILEIGTSLGISTAYLAAGSSDSRVVTLEGNPSSADEAKALFERLKLHNIEVKVGEFGSTLLPSLEDMMQVDLAFIDGNHRKEATIAYFDSILKYTSSKSIIVVDDIYWSVGMNDAWQEIIGRSEVAFSIDLFRMGVVFLDQSIMPKQDFKLIESKWKLWSIGLFG